MPISKEDRFKLELIDLTDDTLVAHAPTNFTNALQPPSGCIYKIVGLKIDIPIPVGGSAGTHSLTVVHELTDTFQHMYVSSAFDTTIYFQMSEGLGGTTKKPVYPNVLHVLNTLYANHDNPINFVYTNASDADQTGTRIIKVLVKKYREMI